MYGLLGVLAAAIGAGDAGPQEGEETLSAALLRLTFGQLLVAGFGVGVAIFGVTQIVRGVKQNFVDDLDRRAGRVSRELGRIDFCAKGLSMIIVGVLFGWSALSDDPAKAGGLEAALGAIRDQPFGAVLLVMMAAGIASFGLLLRLVTVGAVLKRYRIVSDQSDHPGGPERSERSEHAGQLWWQLRYGPQCPGDRQPEQQPERQRRQRQRRGANRHDGDHPALAVPLQC